MVILEVCRLFWIRSLGSAVKLGILGILKLALHLLKFSPMALRRIANVLMELVCIALMLCHPINILDFPLQVDFQLKKKIS